MKKSKKGNISLGSSNDNNKPEKGGTGIILSRLFVILLSVALFGAGLEKNVGFAIVAFVVIVLTLFLQRGKEASIIVELNEKLENAKEDTLALVPELKKEVNALEDKIKELEIEARAKEEKLNTINNNFKDIGELDADKEKILDDFYKAKIEYDLLIEKMDSLKDKVAEATEKELELSKLKLNITEHENELNSLKEEIIETRDEVLLQSFGIYDPKYDCENSEQYAQKLKEIRASQKEMVKNKTGVDYFDGWKVDGDAKKGAAMMNKNIQSLFKLFNTECDIVISKVSYKNLESSEKRIRKSFEQDNKLYEPFKVRLLDSYLNSKIEELYLNFEYAQKKQEEKEEQAALREQMREEARVQKEIEKEKKKIEKEKTHFNTELERLENNIPDQEDERAIWEAKIAELKAQIEELKHVEEDVMNREKNTRAGYVYIISNIGSFGENIYKIGLTRRLDPMERVNELGDASVPFKFDVHATIFSEDAPTLENALHKAFEHRRVNKVNSRKEFFHVTLDEIRAEVEKNFNKTVEYTKYAEAMEYRQSLRIAEQEK